MASGDQCFGLRNPTANSSEAATGNAQSPGKISRPPNDQPWSTAFLGRVTQQSVSAYLLGLRHHWLSSVESCTHSFSYTDHASANTELALCTLDTAGALYTMPWQCESEWKRATDDMMWCHPIWCHIVRDAFPFWLCKVPRQCRCASVTLISAFLILILM